MIGAVTKKLPGGKEGHKRGGDVSYNLLHKTIDVFSAVLTRKEQKLRPGATGLCSGVDDAASMS